VTSKKGKKKGPAVQLILSLPKAYQQNQFQQLFSQPEKTLPPTLFFIFTVVLELPVWIETFPPVLLFDLFPPVFDLTATEFEIDVELD